MNLSPESSTFDTLPGQRRAPKVSVIMPAYNEAESIVANLRETIETLEGMGWDFEVILVDDGSPDQTYRQATQLLAPHGHLFRIVHYEKNEGKGNALTCGSWYAKGEFIVFLDADMDLHPRQLTTFFSIMESENADVVIGSKRHPLSHVNYPSNRRLYSNVYYSMIRLMFGLPVKDTQTGIKLFKREVLQRVLPRVLVKRFAFDIELLANAHRLGFRIVDAPITLHFQRPFGRIKVRDIRNIVIDTLAIYYRMKILRYYDRVGERRLADLPIGERANEIEAHA
jgi:glycosyltransferase involved in cell wall biosynthesis